MIRFALPFSSLGKISKRIPFWKRLLQYEQVKVALILMAILAFAYRDVIFLERSFLVGPGLPGVTPSGPYEHPSADELPLFSTPDPGALAWAMQPWAWMINHSYARGELPLWNPHSGLGYPLYANPHSAPFDPLMIMIHFAPESLLPLMMDFHFLLLCFLGAFFLYRFMRSLGIGIPGAVFAGTAFVISPYVWSNTTLSFVRADLLLPMLVYSYHNLAHKPSKKHTAFAILSLWLIIVTGFPESLPLHMGLAAIWYVWQVLLNVIRQQHPGGARYVITMFAQLAFVIAASVLLGAFILLPFIELLLISHHVHNSLDIPISVDFLTLFVSFIRLIVPLPDQPVHYATINVLVWMLALYAVFKSARRSFDMVLYTRFFVGLALAMFLVAFHAPLFGVLARLPILNMIVLEKYLLVPITFCVTCAAGIGIEILMTQTWRSVDKRIIALSLGFGIPLLFGFLIPIGNVFFQTNYIVHILHIALIVWGFHFILILKTVGKISPRTSTWLVFVWMISSPVWLDSIFMQRPQRYNPYVAPPFVEYLQQQEFPYRILGLDGYLYPNTNGVFGIDDVRYLDAVFPVTYTQFAEAMLFEPDDRVRFTGTEDVIYFGRGLDLLNVEYIITSADNTEFHARIDPETRQNFERVYRDQMVTIYRNHNAFPRAFIVHHAESVLNTEEALERLQNPTFDPSHTVLIENSDIRELPPLVSSLTLQEGTVTARSNNRMVVNATLDQAGWLVVSEQYFPGWDASIDGNPTQIFTANAVMRAVYLEEGTHTVEFIFSPFSFVLGFVLSVSTFVLISGMFVLGYLKQRLNRHNYDYTDTIKPG